MIKKIILGLIVCVLCFLGYAAMRPAELIVSRELLINAPPDAIFPHINNSQRSYEWMPWTEIDPQVKMSYSGPSEGVGATSSWESTGQMGFGKSVVTASTLNQSIKCQLTYTKPFAMEQEAEISLQPAPAGTTVRWTVTGKNDFMGRVVGIFIDMDKMIGTEFEKGLRKLKTIVEKT